MSTSMKSGEPLAVDVSCSDDSLIVVLDDGRTVSVPLVWFPRLLAVTPRQRTDWESVGGGIGMHWKAIDEDISVASLLQPERFMRLAGPASQAPSHVRRRPRSRKPSPALAPVRWTVT
jgi:hypothetical protein